jgi:4-hydroxybenzoate polyprenyltransferase
VTGRLDAEVVVLGGAVLLWVAGFDIVYACQDAAFDRDHGLYSVPQRFGVSAALRASRVLHAAAVALMVAAGRSMGLGVVYFAGVVCVGGLLIYAHRLVRPEDLSKAGASFMNLNAAVSAVYFAFVLGDVVVQ